MSWLKDCLPRKNQYQTMANALEFILNLIKENTLPVLCKGVFLHHFICTAFHYKKNNIHLRQSMYKQTVCYKTSFSVLGMISKSFGFQLKPIRNENLPEWTYLLLARTGPGSHIAGVKMLPEKRHLGRSGFSKVDKYFFNPQSSLNCAIESIGKICQLASHSSKRPMEQTQPFDTIVFTYFSTLACTREMVRSCCFIFNSEKMIENRTRWKYDLSNIISNLDRD